MQECKLIKDNKIPCGILAPNGKLYRCCSQEHYYLSLDLIRFYYGKDGSSKEKELPTHPDEWLKQQGFAHITRGGVYLFNNFDKIHNIRNITMFTDNQIKWLEKHNKNMTAEQKEACAWILSSTNYDGAKYYYGDNELKPYKRPHTRPRIIHTYDEYPNPTQFIKITEMIPVAEYCRPAINSIYPVIKEKNICGERLYVILVDGEEVGVYKDRECKLVSKEEWESESND